MRKNAVPKYHWTADEINMALALVAALDPNVYKFDSAKAVIYKAAAMMDGELGDGFTLRITR